MNSSSPLVSVVCPTKNGALHLRRAIDSVLSQDYRNIELIVIDGASTDTSLEILESYGEQFRFVSEPDSGQSEAINKGFSLCHGEILAWLNADDEYVPGAITAAVEAFAATGADLIYGDALAEDGWGRRYGHRMNVGVGNANSLINERCFIIQPASFWSREVWDTVGPLRPDLHYALDYDFFMRAVSNFSASYWPYTFARERLHSGAKTFQGARNRIDEIREASISNGGHDLPRAFQPEGAAVYTVDALRLASRRDFGAARLALRQARVWTSPFEKYLLFLAATLFAGGRGLPRVRLISNYLVSRFLQRPSPSHNNPALTRYRLQRVGNPARLGRVRHRASAAKATMSPASVVHRLRPRLGQLRQHDPRPLLVDNAGQSLTPPAQYPSITMVTPSFNQGQFLQATIDSVLGQRYPNLEYFVQDGGSTDNSVDVLAAIDDPALSWESKPDGGQSRAINLGHQKGSGEIMAWLNSDDLLLPGTLEHVGAFFAQNPDVDVVYSHRVLIDADGHEIGRWLIPDHDATALTWADYIPQETMFWRRSIWDEVGGIDESFRFAMDWDLLVRFEEAGAKMVRLPIFGGAFRVYDEQLTSSEIESIGAEEMSRIRQRCHGREVTPTEIARGLAPYMAKHLALDRAWRSGMLRY